jgi:hypothetical protein
MISSGRATVKAWLLSDKEASADLSASLALLTCMHA